MEILPRQKWGSLLNNNNEAEDPYSFNGKFMARFFFNDKFAYLIHGS